MKTARCPRRDAGFSLLELLVVLAIVAVGAGLFMPVLGRRSDSTLLRATVRELTEAVRVTRGTAIARNAEMVLTIDVQDGSFGSPATSRRTWAPEIVARVTFAEPEQVSPGSGGFRFYPDGSSSGGDVQFALGTAKARICIDWFTGAAKGADMNGASCSLPHF